MGFLANQDLLCLEFHRAVLGPLLFFVCTSDMVVSLENKIAQYVDNGTLVDVVNSPLMRNEAALTVVSIGTWGGLTNSVISGV